MNSEDGATSSHFRASVGFTIAISGAEQLDPGPLASGISSFKAADEFSAQTGANAVSLEEARRNYRQIGASSSEFIDDVRKPKPEEIPLGER